MKKSLITCIALLLLLSLSGCSSNNESNPSKDTEHPTTQKSGYEGYMETVNTLNHVKSYHLKQITNEKEGLKESFIEEMDVIVGKDSDTAKGIFTSSAKDRNGKDTDVTCAAVMEYANDGSLVVSETRDGCDGTSTYKDGKRYEGNDTFDFLNHLSEVLVLTIDDFDKQNFDFKDNQWIVTGITGKEGKNFEIVLTVDEKGYPLTFTYTVDGFLITTSEFSNIVE